MLSYLMTHAMKMVLPPSNRQVLSIQASLSLAEVIMYDKRTTPYLPLLRRSKVNSKRREKDKGVWYSEYPIMQKLWT
jgi:hypothetical protein